MREGQSAARMANEIRSYIPFLEKLNEYTDFQYDADIRKEIDDRLFKSDLLENNYKAARKRQAFKTASIKRKLYVVVGCVFPQLITKIRKQ